MDFKDRSPKYPGRVKLTPVSGQANIYDMTLQDEASIAGTPLNTATFTAFKEDLIDYINTNPGPQGEKGDRGDPGISLNKCFLVGTNSESGVGWYKIGSITLGDYIDYHAKILITGALHDSSIPSGLLDLDIRRGPNLWEYIGVKWETCNDIQPKYVGYYAQSDGTINFYAYIPYQFAFYRIDILSESNRDVFNYLFNPIVPYGGISQTRYSSNRPAITGYPETSYRKFYVWDYAGVVPEDKVLTCTETRHGIKSVKCALVIPKSNAKTDEELNGWNSFAQDNIKYGVLIEDNTVYVGLDVGEFKEGFYCLIYGE